MMSQTSIQLSVRQICPQCGYRLDPTEKACPRCATMKKVEVESATAAAPPAPRFKVAPSRVQENAVSPARSEQEESNGYLGELSANDREEPALATGQPAARFKVAPSRAQAPNSSFVEDEQPIPAALAPITAPRETQTQPPPLPDRQYTAAYRPKQHVMVYGLVARPTRPASVTIIGVLLVVLACLNALRIIHTATMAEILCGISNLVVAGVLGCGLLALRQWARKWSVLLIVVSFILTSSMLLRVLAFPAFFPPALCEAILNGIFIFFLTRPDVVKAFDA